jgi:hypothetical protein
MAPRRGWSWTERNDSETKCYHDEHCEDELGRTRIDHFIPPLWKTKKVCYPFQRSVIRVSVIVFSLADLVLCSFQCRCWRDASPYLYQGVL